MEIPTIGIIGGKGRMGQLFAKFFRDRGIQVIISDLNTKLTNEELSERSDIVIISVPIDVTVSTIEKVIARVNKNAAIMDLTSIKEKPVKAMLKGKCEVLGMHPMFGNGNPIPGQTIILTPTKKSGKWAQWMESFLKENGAEVIKMKPKDHDKIMAVSQGVIHFSDIAFADALRRTKIPIEEIYRFASSASQLKIQLAARLIDQSENLYGNIQIQNSSNIKPLKYCQKASGELFKIVKKGDLKGFYKYFRKNKKYLGKFTELAYKDTSYLIDKFNEKKRKGSLRPKVQKLAKKSVAVLGPANTFTDLGAEKYLFQHNLKNPKYYTQSIDEIFELVEGGKVEFGIAPIENKLHGTVRQTIDLLFEKDVHVIEEFNLSIEQNLIVLKHVEERNIEKILSHDQALNQCKNFIREKFPKAEIQNFSSTAASVEKLLVSRNSNMAVIASSAAANHPDLKVLYPNIADEKDNITTFVVIKKGKTPKTAKGEKTSIAFYFDSDSPGSLFTVFADFAKAKINLTKIESRPTKGKFGDYIFYLDFEGGINDAKVSGVLDSIKKKVANFKILGTYKTWT